MRFVFYIAFFLSITYSYSQCENTSLSKEFYECFTNVIESRPNLASEILTNKQNKTLNEKERFYYNISNFKLNYYLGEIDSLEFFLNSITLNFAKNKSFESYLFYLCKSQKYKLKSNFDSSFFYLEEAIRATPENSEYGFEAYISLAYHYLIQGDENYYQNYLDSSISKSRSYIDSSRVLVLKSSKLIIENNLDEALESLLELKSDLTRIGFDRGDLYLSTLENIGNVYIELKMFDEAKLFYNDAVLLAKQTKNKLKEQSNRMNLSVLNLNINNLDEAKKQLNILIDQSKGNQGLLSTAYYNLSELALIQNNKTLAKQYIEKCLFIDSTHKNLLPLSFSFLHYGKVMLALDSVDKAIKSFNESIKISERIKNNKLLVRNFFYLSKAYEQKNDYKLAYQNYLKSKDLNEEVGGFELAKNVEEITAKYRTKELKEINNSLKRRLDKYFIYIVSFSFLLSILLLSFILYVFYTKKKKGKLLDKMRLIENKLSKVNNNNSSNIALYESQKKLIKTLSSNKNWADFMMGFNALYGDLLYQIKLKNNKLSVKDTRLIALIKLNLLDKEISDLLGIEYNSMRKAKSRLKDKIGLNSSESIENYINSF